MAEPTQSDWLTRKHAARFLATQGVPISPRTLEKWAQNNNVGGGPPFIRLKTKIIRYLKADLQAWVQREVMRVE